MRIPQETIEQIRDRADIAEVAARYLELRRVGRNLKALCPFHEEKTASFFVSPERQSFHCFGCDKGGNVFTFVMEMEGVSFPEAVKSLGQQYGVQVQTYEVPAEERSQNEGLYQASEFAARWYHRMLADSKSGQAARRYLEERGINEGSWKAFSLGFAPENWDGLFRAARKQRVSIENLRAAKLIVSREGKTGYYDYFRNRLMFPIRSMSGRVIAFGARTLDAEGEPKYLNSPENPVFSKRRTLYGLPNARDAIRERREAVIVEGYTDCISLHQAGFCHAVASCGTALTGEHASVLRRVTRKLTLIPDGDEAGERASLQAGMLLLAAGLEVRMVRLDRGDDPDGAVRKLGREKFEKLLVEGMAYFEYFDYIVKDRIVTPLDREALVKRVLSGLDGSVDPLRREMLIQDLAKVLSIDADSLRMRASHNVSGGTADGRQPSAVKGSNRAQREKLVLRLLLEDTAEVAAVRQQLDGDDFSEENCRKYYKLLDFAWETNIDLKSNEFQRKAEEIGLEGFAAEIALVEIPPGIFVKLLTDTIRRIKELKIRDELNALREKLKRLPADSEDAVAVAEYSRKLQQALSEL
ncbi:MAG: DNA primase [Candidatus Latescibacterota bacterium]